jgi:hypothetical protein
MDKKEGKQRTTEHWRQGLRWTVRLGHSQRKGGSRRKGEREDLDGALRPRRRCTLAYDARHARSRMPKATMSYRRAALFHFLWGLCGDGMGGEGHLCAPLEQNPDPRSRRNLGGTLFTYASAFGKNFAIRPGLASETTFFAQAGLARHGQALWGKRRDRRA